MKSIFRVTSDPEARAAYLYLIGAMKPGEAARILPVTPDINLDFDAEGRLIGIELLSLELLHPILAAQAEKPGSIISTEEGLTRLAALGQEIDTE